MWDLILLNSDRIELNFRISSWCHKGFLVVEKIQLYFLTELVNVGPEKWHKR